MDTAREEGTHSHRTGGEIKARTWGGSPSVTCDRRTLEPHPVSLTPLHFIRKDVRMPRVLPASSRAPTWRCRVSAPGLCTLGNEGQLLLDVKSSVKADTSQVPLPCPRTGHSRHSENTHEKKAGRGEAMSGLEWSTLGMGPHPDEG